MQIRELGQALERSERFAIEARPDEIDLCLVVLVLQAVPRERADEDDGVEAGKSKAEEIIAVSIGVKQAQETLRTALASLVSSSPDPHTGPTAWMTYRHGSRPAPVIAATTSSAGRCRRSPHCRRNPLRRRS